MRDLRFFAPELDPQTRTLELKGATAHHILHVLRVSRGSTVLLFNGQGLVHKATLVEATTISATFTIGERVESIEGDMALHLLLGLPKAQSADRAMRMAAETGATHIHPFLAERSTKMNDRADRWERICSSAAQQCGRPRPPKISPLSTLASILAALPAELDRYIATPGLRENIQASQHLAILIGPEGGLSDKENLQAMEHGFRPISLGPWALRTETAVAVGLGLAHQVTES